MQWALFEGLAPESVDRILAAARRVRLSRGKIMFHEGEHGDSVYLVERGKVAVRISTPDGALRLYRRDFAELRRQHPSVTEFLVKSLAATVRRMDAQLVEALHLPVETRIRRRLHALAQVYDSGAQVIRVDLTQEELAQLAGATRPTLNRVLRGRRRAAGGAPMCGWPEARPRTWWPAVPALSCRLP